MALRLYNTLSKRKELFKPQKPKRVGIYTCGPTVYDFAHIGNLSAYIMADLLRRYLEYKGYKVKHIKNITDVGHLIETPQQVEASDSEAQTCLGSLDKIEYRAIKEKKTPQDIARFFEAAFLADEKKLNIKKAHKFPRATEHIKEMIDLIEKLLKKGYAYKTKSGIYFDVLKFKDYGKLSGNTLTQLKAGARVDVREEKKNPFDFALWIFDPKHLMQFESPFGAGYPGWHIECSAMATKYLGTTLDIHTGGEDNIFPHHESEIAQSECALNKKFVQYWMHKRHLLVDNKKMSKSLGNFYTLADLEKRGFNPLVFRYLVLSAHYRTKMNFTWRSMEQAKESIERIDDFIYRINKVIEKKSKKEIFFKNISSNDALINKLKNDFERYLDDDLDTPKAFAAIFSFISTFNSLIDHDQINRKEVKKILKLILKFDTILGLDILERVKNGKNLKKLDKEADKLYRNWHKAWQKKDYKTSDRLRTEIKNKYGIEIIITNNGVERRHKLGTLKIK